MKQNSKPSKPRNKRRKFDLYMSDEEENKNQNKDDDSGMKVDRETPQFKDVTGNLKSKTKKQKTEKTL